MKSFIFEVKNKDGSISTSYEEEITEEQEKELRRVIYKIVKENDGR